MHAKGCVKIEIRAVKFRELLQVYRIIRQNFKWYRARFPFFAGRSILEPGRHSYVCVINKEVKGVAITKEENYGNTIEWRLFIMIMKKDYRQKGYGKQLLRFIESEAKESGVRKIHLFVDDRNSAFKFYEDEGYQRGHRKMLEKYL